MTPDRPAIPGGTFRMGSNDHYPEEQPAHRVPVGGLRAGGIRKAPPAADSTAPRLSHIGFHCVVRQPT